MRYLSICSGIEAATVAWHPLGWTPWAFAETETFPRAVLAHHYPDIPNLGDVNGWKDWPDAAIDVLVGGTPCQSFSVAGLRGGMADPRGNLALVYLAIADRYRPEWLVWENVPGVLSSNGGRDFAAFVGGLEQLGYHAAWRVFDAQYVRVDGFARAVPQRRRRVFVVGHLGDWRRSAAVLFERESLSGHPAPRRKAGKGIAAPVAPCLRAGGNETGGDRPYGTDVDTCDSLIAFTAKDHGGDAQINLLPTLRAGGFTESHANAGVMPAIAFDARQSDVIQYGDRTGPLDTDGHTMAVAFDTYNQTVSTDGTTQTLCSRGDTPGGNAHLVPAVQSNWAVRRLTPIECERLQGFPDGYTLVPYRGKPAADGPRYKALGNSMACNVMRWLGRRIEMVEGTQ
jgi:DNA (cytosine-5)-methyltransferase 1